MTTKQLIINFVNSKDRFVSGMELEDQAHAWQTKASTISRRARELADEGKIQVSYSFKHTAQYRALEKATRPDHYNIKATSWLKETI